MSREATESRAKPRKPGDGIPPTCGNVISKVISVRADRVVPEPLEFVWEPYLQRGALNGFYGNPGVGKGNVGIEIIACLTAPRTFPGENEKGGAKREPINCCVLAAEEGVANTIVPRLKAAGADLARVRIIKSIEFYRDGMKLSDRLVTFQEDIAAIREDLLLHPEEKFLLVDPITSYVGDINFNQDAEVRPVLQLLVNLAEELKITILIIGHFNKNSNVANALDKPGGARAWVSVPRSVWGFFRNPEDQSERVIANLKLNNAKESETSLLFTIGEKQIGVKPDGTPWRMPFVVWGDRTPISANEMVAAEQPENRRDNKGVEFLQQFLAGAPRLANDVYVGAEKEQIHARTIKRACVTLGIVKYEIWGEGWFWQLPADKTPIPIWARNLNPAARSRRPREREPPEAQ
jgi:hypothetical protein